MAEVAGRVVAVAGAYARVECAAEQSGCGACARGRGCSWQRSGSRALQVPAGAPAHRLAPGDVVLVGVDDGDLLLGALRVYLPPILGMLAAPALLRWTGVAGDGPALLGSLAGLALGCLVARRLAARHAPGIRVRRLDGAGPSGAS